MKSMELVFHKYSKKYRKETVEVSLITIDLEALPETIIKIKEGFILYGAHIK
jgi:hypothetical protein